MHTSAAFTHRIALRDRVVRNSCRRAVSCAFAHTRVCQVVVRSGRCLLALLANAAGWCHRCVHVRVCASVCVCVLHLDVYSSSLFSLQTDEAAVSSASLCGSSSSVSSCLASEASRRLPLTPVSRQLKMAADAKICRLQSTKYIAGTHTHTLE